MSFNSITIMGNLTRDPETKTTPRGQNVTDFGVAVNNRNGQEESTMFFNCSMWGARGETIAKYLRKGNPIVVSGQLSQRSWTSNSGENRVSLEINVDNFSFVRDGSRNGGAQTSSNNSNEGNQEQFTDDISDEPIDLSDIPF